MFRDLIRLTFAEWRSAFMLREDNTHTSIIELVHFITNLFTVAFNPLKI